MLFARYSLDVLRRMAVGELTGYEVRRAEPNIRAALRVDDTAPWALDILGRYPGRPAQQQLADFVLDAKRGVLRIKAAEELNRHVKKNGVALAPEQVTDLPVAQLLNGPAAGVSGLIRKPDGSSLWYRWTAKRIATLLASPAMARPVPPKLIAY